MFITVIKVITVTMLVRLLSFLPNTMRWSLPCVMVWGLPFWFQNCFCFKFWTLQNYAGKFWPPQNHKGPPLWWKFWKIVGMLILIAQKKRPDALNTMQKTPAICNVPFLKKSRKTSKNYLFWQKLQKRPIFQGFSWFFPKPYFEKTWGFLRCIQCIRTLLLSYQNPLSDNFSVFVPKGGTLMI